MTTTSCTNCGEACGPDDVFCEACGFDFVTGSLPNADMARPPSLVTPAAGAPTIVFDVSVDRAFFEEVVTEGEIEFPDPVPADQRLELTGTELHIGRTSETRAVHPDIDVAALTGDPAVSTRHAVLRVAADDTLSVLDIGSTNGTFLASPESAAIEPGEGIPVEVGGIIFVGAWTRLTVVEVVPATVASAG